MVGLKVLGFRKCLVVNEGFWGLGLRVEILGVKVAGQRLRVSGLGVQGFQVLGPKAFGFQVLAPKPKP